jgi:hypothetical protein
LLLGRIEADLRASWQAVSTGVHLVLFLSEVTDFFDNKNDASAQDDKRVPLDV